jgi:two-component system phosphate regulon sensor histidine kinase PhoR
MSPVIVLSIAVLALAVISIINYFVRPWLQIRNELARMASGNFALPPVREKPGPYVDTAAHIQRISELLLKLDREVADEDLSLRGILSSMVEGILIVNRSQKITLVNDALVGFFSPGRSPLGRGVLEYFRRHEIQKAVEQTLDGANPSQLDITFETPTASGSPVKKHYHVYVAPLRPESATEPQAAIMVFQDVTAIKSLEATRREFIANVSHEFRTPLAIINGYVETLLDGAIDDPDMADRSLQAIHRNVQRLTLLIEDLLSISQLESKAKLLELAPVNLRDLFYRVIQNLEPKIEEQQALIEIDWPAEAQMAMADSRRMEQVYWNLVTNALRHGDVQNLIIRVSATCQEKHIVISIADNGQGIPLEDQFHIFERFYRVHKDRSRDAGGTGLGLSIVKNIILAHGGAITLDSNPGDGATFIIRMPLAFLNEEPNPNFGATFSETKGLMD